MRAQPPELPGRKPIESPLEQALALLLAGEHEAALRWAGAAIEHEPSTASALILTCRLLASLGRREAAKEGFALAIERAIDAGNLPLAVAGAADLRTLGFDVGEYLDTIASAFCTGSPRLAENDQAPPPPLPHLEDFQPLSSFLSGPALLSKTTAIVHSARQSYEAEKDGPPPLVPPLPLFSALEKDGLRALIGAFQMITVPAGQAVIEEGQEGAEAYIVARGELEVRKERSPESTAEVGAVGPLVLARLTNGALFGEMALLSRAPRAASVVATRPSILLVATRDALEQVAEQRPDVGGELAAHCRRRMVTNLVRISPVLVTVDPAERAALVERLETQVFEKGEKLIREGEESTGLYLVASGEVAVIGHEQGEPLVIATLGVGETAGEISLVLRRKHSADVVAVHPTVTLFLPREDFTALVREHPLILHRLYMLAAQRDDETQGVLRSSITSVGDDYVLL